MFILLRLCYKFKYWNLKRQLNQTAKVLSQMKYANSTRKFQYAQMLLEENLQDLRDLKLQMRLK